LKIKLNLNIILIERGILMKREGIFNEPILKAMGSMGHTDKLVLCDAELPIPKGVKKIDLAVIKGVVGFLEVLAPLLKELVVEKIIIASEIQTKSPDMYCKIMDLAKGIPIEQVSHEEFKVMTVTTKAIIRTGECTPFANVILQMGVNF
jgi:D-ribose pyranase